MNHIYKVIWNKARACWQVVSELAGGSGKLPSARRRGRRSGAQRCLRSEQSLYKKIGIAVLLGSAAAWSLAGAGSNVQASPVAGETTGGGGQYYGTIGNQAAFTTPANASQYQTVFLADWGDAMINLKSHDGSRSIYDGSVGGIKPDQWAATLGYEHVMLKLPDGSLIPVAQFAETPSQLIGAMNSAYWLNPQYAQEIQAALTSGDYSQLEHLPVLYGETGGSRYQLGMDLWFEGWASSVIVDSTSAGQSTYSSASVAGVWRPMDRTETIGSYINGQYSVEGREKIEVGTGSFEYTARSAMDDWGVVYGPTVDNTAPPVTNSAATVITVDDLTTGANSVIDLSYLNTTTAYGAPIVSDLDNNARYLKDGESLRANRTLLVKQAELADGTTFRLGSYAIRDSGSPTVLPTIARGMQDSVLINTATTPDGGAASLHIQLGWLPELGGKAQGGAVAPESGNPVILLGILNGAEQFTVTGQTSLADGIFSKYEITPVLGQLDNYFTDPAGGADKGTAWTLQSYSYIDTGMISESGMSAADNTTVMGNLWQSNYLSLFRKAGTLHRSSPAAMTNAGAADQKENLWAEVWHGEYKSAAAYGRRVSQNYNGLQVGYDKLLKPRIANGDVYAGFYVGKVEADSHSFSGGGEQDSLGLTAYASWIGDKGHFLDAAVTAARLSNDYHLMTTTADGSYGRVNADYSTWGYGLGLRYGYQAKRENGWFLEPSVALFAGHVDETSYSLSNNLGVRQGGYDTVTGKLALAAGRELAGNGNVYAAVAAVHDFAGGSALSSYYGDQTRAIDTVGGKDSWWEFSLGGNFNISPSGVFNLNLTKTTGSDSGNDWKLNGGLNWSWGGFWGSRDGGQTADRAVTDSGGAAVVVGQPLIAQTAEPLFAPSAGRQAAVATGAEAPGTAIDAAAKPLPAAVDPIAAKPQPSASAEAKSVPVAAADAVHTEAPAGGDFSFAPLTVEASRPEWEKKLSPGQVSVVYPAEFAGEQKDLPDLLERVPGLFVQRISGDGHYTVARVRGSTGAQVNVYVDGVLMNLNGDTAVNLSTIPVDNVERVEVYRGYVPARFSGSPLGGVINIVTKKPDKLGGSVSQGLRSYGGYTGNYQLTTPLGDGSLLATYQRDIWDGDFRFANLPQQRPDAQEGSYGDLHRRSNGYQNSDGMVKWQNDNWMVKAAWKDLHEQLPRSVARLEPIPPWHVGYEDYLKGYNDAEMDIRQKEIQISRRDTIGELDWNWKLYYLDSRKDYQATGLQRSGYVDPFAVNWPGFLWSEFHSKKWGGNVNSALKMGDSHLLEFNFDYSHETMDADGSSWDIWNNHSSHKDSKRQFIHKYTIKEYHLTLQDSISLNQAGDFKFTPIARADKVEMSTLSDSDREWQYSGGVALQKQLNPNWSVKTSWGTYNRHPNFYELFGDGATIQPNEAAEKFFGAAGQGTWERGTQFDFSVNWQGELARADTDTVLTWFQRDAKNQFALWQPNVPNAPGSYFPMDTAEVHGIELTHNMQWERFSLNLAGTWQKSEYESSQNVFGGHTYGHKSAISYTPEWVWNARLNYRFPGDKLNVFAEYHYMDEQFTGIDSNSSGTMQALSTVDLGVKYAFNNGWKLNAGVNDIFNKGYDLRQTDGLREFTLGYPLAGRMYYATVEHKF
ncbi:MAG: TonB-dependent receptor [Sporomusaceae bacterium]|nr:TonB-dependent receptor [Sporomusaceae bacterium]